MKKERHQENKQIFLTKSGALRQESGNFGKCQSTWGRFGFPKRANFHLRYVLGESVYRFQPTALRIVSVWTPPARPVPGHASTYAGPWRRASRLARGWAPWTCWASSAAHRWCRPGSPGPPAWTWPWAGWRWWCWAPKWRPWGTRRRWKCWPAGRRDVARSRDEKGQQSGRLCFISRSSRETARSGNLFPSLTLVAFVGLLHRGKNQKPLTYVHSHGSTFKEGKFIRIKLHRPPLFSAVHCHKCLNWNRPLIFSSCEQQDPS